MTTLGALTAWRITSNGYGSWQGQATVTAARRQAAALASTVLPALLRAAGQEGPAAVGLRRELHASPELGGHETRTAIRVAAAVRDTGDPAVTAGRLVLIEAGCGTSAVRGARL